MDVSTEITAGLSRLVALSDKLGMPHGSVQNLFEAVHEHLDQGNCFDDVAEDIANGPFKVTAKGALIVHKLLMAVSRYAQAAWSSQAGDDVGAWKALYRASLEHGGAIAIQVTAIERKHRQKAASEKGGKRRGAANERIQEWVLSEAQKRPSAGPYEIGASLGQRFYPHRGAPAELKLSDFGSKLKLDHVEKRFGEWIAADREKEFLPLAS